MTDLTRTALARSRLLAAAALTGALALTGCTTHSATSAAALTARAGIVKLTTGNFVSTIEAAQEKAGSAHEHLAITAARQTVTIDANITGLGDASKTALRENLTISGQPAISVIEVAKKVYVNLGKDSGNTYLDLSSAAPSSAAGKQAASIDSAVSQSDPTGEWGAMKTAVQYVQRAGDPTTIDGVATTPYVVGIDTAPLAATLGTLTGADAALPPQLDIDYWIGPDGLPRRISLLVGGADEEEYFTHWGAAVVVAPPTVHGKATPTTASAAAADWRGEGGAPA